MVAINANDAAAYPADEVLFLAVNQQEQPQTIQTFLESHGWEANIALDRDGEVARKYQVDGIPQTVVIDQSGKIARLFELKGHEDVITAAMYLDRDPNLRFLFVGDGLWRDKLQQRIDAAGMHDRFQFTGLVPPARIPELLGAMDILVHASRREGLARALPQALPAPCAGHTCR